MTITLDEIVYYKLYSKIGKRKISSYIESLIRPQLMDDGIELGYRAMAADELRENEALLWSESLIGDVADEPR